MHVRQRRARRAVLAGLAAFAALQLLLAGELERPASRVRDPLGARRARRLRAHPGADRLLVAGVGSSRTLNGLRGDVAGPRLSAALGRRVAVVNQGVPAAGPLRNLITTHRLLRQGARADLVTVEVLPALLTERGRRFEAEPGVLEAWQLRGEEALLIRALVADRRPRLLREYVAARLGAAFHARFQLLNRAAGTLLPTAIRCGLDVPVDRFGWFGTPNDLPGGKEHHRRLALENYRPHYAELETAPLQEEALRRTLRLAREAGARTALVLMPEGPIFRALYPPERWARMRAGLQRLADEEGAALLDFRHALPEESFIDSHHLTSDGAARYTELLADRLAPLLAAPPSDAGGLARR